MRRTNHSLQAMTSSYPAAAAAAIASTAGTSSSHLNPTFSPYIYHLPAREGVAPVGVAVVLGWMRASARHLEKYARLYHSRDYEVMVVAPQMHHLLKPSATRNLLANLTSMLVTQHRSHEVDGRKILLQSMSIGAFMTAEWIRELRAKAGRVGENILDNVVGQVHDSPVDYSHVPESIARLVTADPTRRGIVTSTLSGIMPLRPKLADTYRRASDTFWDDPLQCPALWLYGDDDPLCPATTCEALISEWRKLGVECTSAVFHRSRHCEHHRHQTAAYEGNVLSFLDARTQSGTALKTLFR
eukprot:PhM_4_TR9829/c0_g1_i1/m.23418